MTVSALLSGGMGGWRGRAQQIISLQDKVSELQRQVTRLKAKGCHSSAPCTPGIHSEPNSRQRLGVDKIQAERKKNIEELQAKLDRSQSLLQQSKQQIDALKARNNTLASDCKDLRAKSSALTTQLADKDRLLAEVRSQTLNNDSRKVQETLDKLQRENNKLRAQLTRSEDQINNLRYTAGSRGAIPSPLPLLPAPGQACGDVPISQTDGMGTDLPLRHRTNRRDLSIRQSLSADTVSARPLANEQGSAITKVMEVERDKLLELSQLLQKRLDATTDRLSRTENELRQARQAHVDQQRHALLEQAGHCSDHQTCLMMELQGRLSILEDENAALRETLKFTRQEKVLEFTLASSLAQKTRHKF